MLKLKVFIFLNLVNYWHIEKSSIITKGKGYEYFLLALPIVNKDCYCTIFSGIYYNQTLEIQLKRLI
jgi:hypothetical protein